jgi:hypothetical protein
MTSEESLLRPEQLDEDLKREEPLIVRIVDGFSGSLIKELHSPVPLNNVFFNDPSPFIPAAEICDLPTFYDIGSRVVKDAQDREGTVESEQVQIVQEFQPERWSDINADEIIVCKVISRSPAKMDRKGTGREQRASTHYRDLRSAEYPNKVITVETRPIDHIIGFDVWGKTATLANRRALWLEKLFVTHKWAFTVNGVERFWWKSRGQDTLWKGPGESRLHQRPLQFFVRLREFEVYAAPTIKQFELTTSYRNN